jgi:uncharacterized oligopeptide transporter (OPT) family protein
MKYKDSGFGNYISIILGAILGAFFCILNVIVSLKIGLGFGSAQVVALLGYFALKMMGNYGMKQNNIVQAAASGGYLSMFAIDSSVVACMIYGKGIIPVFIIFGLGITSTIIGIIIAYWIEPVYVDADKLPFPTGTATAETIRFLAQGSSQNQSRYLFIGIAISVIINVLVQILNVFPPVLPGGVFGKLPSFIGLVVSPLIFGLGFMINWKSALIVFTGSIFSCVIWILDEGALSSIKYSQHSNNMWILSVGTAVMVASAILSLWDIRGIIKKIWGQFFNIFKDNQKSTKYYGLWAFILGILTFFNFYMLNPSWHIILSVLIVLLPMTFITVLFCCKASGETGLNPITPLGIITFCLVALLSRDFKVIVFGGAFVCAAGLSASTMINSLKSGKLLETPKKELFKAQTVGAFFGVLVGSITIYKIGSIYNFGSENMPTPVSIVWGTIVDTLSQGQIPSNINLYLTTLGTIIAFVLTKLKLSAVCFGIGVIIPPSYSLTLLVGGLFRLYIGEKNKTNPSILKTKLQEMQSAMSGLIAGEGIVVLIMFIMQIITNL